MTSITIMEDGSNTHLHYREVFSCRPCSPSQLQHEEQSVHENPWSQSSVSDGDSNLKLNECNERMTYLVTRKKVLKKLRVIPVDGLMDEVASKLCVVHGLIVT